MASGQVLHVDMTKVSRISDSMIIIMLSAGERNFVKAFWWGFKSCSFSKHHKCFRFLIFLRVWTLYKYEKLTGMSIHRILFLGFKIGIMIVVVSSDIVEKIEKESLPGGGIGRFLTKIKSMYVILDTQGKRG